MPFLRTLNVGTLSFNFQVCGLDFGFSGTCPHWLGGPSQAFISLLHIILCAPCIVRGIKGEPIQNV